MKDSGTLPLPARALIVSIAAGGVVCLIARLPDVANWNAADVVTWAALLAGVVVTELQPIPLRHRTETLNFSVTEAVWVGALILARPGVLTLAVAAGILLGQILHRRPAYKLAFNLGQYVLALTAAQWIYALLNPQAILKPSAWLAAGLAMAAYSVLNAGLVALVISLVERQPFLSILVPPLKVNALHFAANTAIGLEGAVVWAVSPIALLLLLTPLILAHVAYRTLVRALREGERARELIIQHASDGIFLIAPEGTILSWNPAMERITGFCEAEATGRKWKELLALREGAVPGSAAVTNGHASGANGHVPASAGGHKPKLVSIGRLASTKGHRPSPSTNGHTPKSGIPASLVRKDGSQGWIQYSGNEVRTGDGKVDMMVVVVHDVTAQRQTEQLKSDFVATISHELRTPLTPLKGFLSTLVQGTVEDTREARQEYYEIMLKQTNRLERLITELLEVSRVESDIPLVASQAVDVSLPIREQIRGYVDQQPDRVIRFDKPEHPIMVSADPQVMSLVLSNLIGNALKYSPQDRPIEVSVAADDASAVISVRDQGIGIPSAEQEKVFDRFYQVENAHLRTNGGVGLGLYISRRLVEAMSGRLWVESEPGNGSTFSFQLPLAVGDGSDLAIVAPSLGFATAI